VVPLTASKNLESQASSTPAIDEGAKGEHSAAVKFSLQCHGESCSIGTKPPEVTGQKEVPPIKLLLERLGGISAAADNGNLNAEGQAKVAWNRLFQPEGFSEKSETVADYLSLEKNIYG
jgi:hypothetical protein